MGTNDNYEYLVITKYLFQYFIFQITKISSLEGKIKYNYTKNIFNILGWSAHKPKYNKNAAKTHNK